MPEDDYRRGYEDGRSGRPPAPEPARCRTCGAHLVAAASGQPPGPRCPHGCGAKPGTGRGDSRFG